MERGRGERESIQGLNSMLVTSQGLCKLFPAWQPPSPSSPALCSVSMAADTVLDPENGRMQLGGYRDGEEKVPSLKAGAHRLLCRPRSNNP